MERDDKLTVYDGSATDGTKLLDEVASTASNVETIIPTVASTGQSMTLCFLSNDYRTYAGLDLTVTVGDPTTDYAIKGLDNVTGGTVVASVDGQSTTTARLRDVVTLTATPGSDYLLNSLSVADADDNPVALTWEGSFFNTATFTMPLSAVTVTPTFTNNLTADGGLYVNMPKTDSKALTIPTGVQSLKVYDDGGADGNYSNNCDGILTLTAPENCLLLLSGNITTEDEYDEEKCDFLIVYDGSTANYSHIVTEDGDTDCPKPPDEESEAFGQRVRSLRTECPKPSDKTKLFRAVRMK